MCAREREKKCDVLTSHSPFFDLCSSRTSAQPKIISSLSFVLLISFILLFLPLSAESGFCKWMEGIRVANRMRRAVVYLSANASRVCVCYSRKSIIATNACHCLSEAQRLQATCVCERKSDACDEAIQRYHHYLSERSFKNSLLNLLSFTAHIPIAVPNTSQ